MLDTLEPKWERGVELFVADFSLVSLNFIVYDWDGPFVGDDFLGAAKLTLEKVISFHLSSLTFFILSIFLSHAGQASSSPATTGFRD